MIKTLLTADYYNLWSWLLTCMGNFTRTTRAIIVVVLTIVFLVSAPLLLLYAFGFRYDFSRGRVEKVGIVILKYEPYDASVLLDGISQDALNLFGYIRIRNVQPGDHQVSIGKDTYTTWSKTLTVREDVVSWARYVRLFKQMNDSARKPVTTDLDVTGTIASPNGRYLALTANGRPENNGVYTLNTNGDHALSKIFPISKTDIAYIDKQLQVTDVQWASDNRHMLVAFESRDDQDQNQTTKHFRLIDTRNPNTPFVLKDRLDTISELDWQFNSGQKLLVVSEGNVFTYTPETSELSDLEIPVTTDQATALSNQHLVYLSDNTADNSLDVHVFNIADQSDTILGVVNNEHYSFSLSETGRLSLLGSNGSLYAVVSPSKLNQRSSMALLSVSGDVLHAVWGKDNDEEQETDEALLYHTAHELALYDTAIENIEVLTRFEEPMHNAGWFDTNYKYAYFVVGNVLKVIELDEQGQRNIADLYTYTDNRLPLFAPNQNNDQMFVVDKASAVSGARDVFVLPIR